MARVGSSGAVSRLLEIGILIAFGVTLVYVASFAVKATQSSHAERQVPEVTLRVQLLNGCAVRGVTNIAADKLPRRVHHPLAVSVVDTDNFTVFDIEKSFVISRTPDLEAARLLAFQLGLSIEDVSFAPIEDNYRSVQVSIVIGKDYKTSILR